MDQDLEQQEALAARRDALRERLRARAEHLLETVECLPAPKTFLEAERAARAIVASDKMLMQVFSAPKVAVSAKRAQRPRFERVVDAPIVTSSPLGFAAPLPPYADAKGEDEVSDTASEDKSGTSVAKAPFRRPSRKALTSSASSFVIGAPRPDLVLKEIRAGLSP